MKKKITFLIAAAVMLLTMMASTGTMWGQSDYSSDYTGNITLSTAGGSNASACEISIGNTSYAGIKAGTSSKVGAVKVTVPSGTKYLHIHAAAWNNTTASLEVTPTGYSDNIALTANSGIANNSPFTFNGNANTSDYYKVITFSDALTANTDLTFTAVGGKRFVIWGVTSEEEGGSDNPSISAENVNIAYNATNGSIEYTVNNPVSGGSLTASTTATWLTTGTTSNTAVPFACEENDGAERSATVTLTYTYSAKETVTKNVTVTQAGNPNVVDNISDITATGNYSVKGTIVAKSSRGFIVGDGTGYVYYYNQNYTQADYNIGDKVKLVGAVSVYGGVYQFTSTATITSSETSNYVAEDPTVLSGADMDSRVSSTTQPQLSSYVQYVGKLSVSGTYYNITDIDGASTAKGSISYPLSTDFAALNGKTVTVTGYYVGVSSNQYYNTMLGTIEEIVGNVADPTFDPEPGTFEYPVDVTLDCATAGASIYYTTDGTTPTASSTLFEGDEIAVEETTTIKAIAIKGTESSNVTTATYHINSINDPYTVAEALAFHEYPTSTIFVHGIVSTAPTQAPTADGQMTYYISDNGEAANQLQVYKGKGLNGDAFTAQTDIQVGDIVTVTGIVKIYNSTKEFDTGNYLVSFERPAVPSITLPAYSFDVNADGGGNEIPVTYTNMPADPQAEVVFYESDGETVTTYSWITATIKTNGNIDGHIDANDGAARTAYFKVKGIDANNNDVYSNLVTINQAASAGASIVFNTTSLDIMAGGENRTMSFDYEGLGNNPTFSVNFYSATGEPTTYSWITAVITAEEKVNITVNANTGAARTAYFKVYGENGGVNALSNIVTINQAAGSTPPTSGWVLTNLADLTADDIFVIVGTLGDATYAIPNDNGTNAPGVVAVTVSNGALSGEPATNIQWNMSGNATDGYTFYPNGDDDNWLYCSTTAASGSNNNIKVGTGDRKVFELDSNGYLVTNDDNVDRYLSIYVNSGTAQDWRGYINSNSAPTIAFYKKVEDPSAPSITANNVNIAYDATEGVIEYTINNPVAGASFEAVPTHGGDVFNMGQAANGTVPFTCSVNPNATERTATVELRYTYNRATIIKEVIITQAGNPEVVSNISDITAEGDYTVQGTIVAISNRGFILGDGTGYAYYYEGSGFAPNDYTIGDKKKMVGTVSSYNHVYQFPDGTTITDVTTSNYDNTPAVQVLDAAGMSAYNNDLHLSDYVQFEGTLVKSGNYYNVQVADLSTDASISFPTDAQAATLDALENKTVVVKGYFAGVSSGHFGVVLESAEEISTESITVSPNEINVDASEHDGTLTIAVSNMTITDPNADLAIEFYDGNGTTITKPDWVDFDDFDESGENFSVYYIIAENDGDYRQAFFKVYGMGDTGLVYSNLVSINQEAPVTPPTGDEYDLYSGALVEGDYLIVFDNCAMNTTVTSNRLMFDEVTPDNNVITTDNTAIVWHIAPSGEYWTIYNSTANAYAASTNSKNQATMITDGTSDNALWTATGNETYEFENKARAAGSDPNNKWLRKNGTYGFACYATSTGGALSLYKKVEDPTAATIAVSPSTVNAPAVATNGALTVTYHNINMSTIDIEWTSEAPNWVTLTFDSDNNVEYIISENIDTAARTASFKVTGQSDNTDEDVFSNEITINQAGYVIDYATLPFAFDGGRADIETTVGLTQNGLDSDYGASPKLKFNTTGDWVILKLNAAPASLSYDIKGNSFSGGTFDVELSADGVNYTNLASYTELSDVQPVTHIILDDNTRYVRWIYTTKSSGNVALGNIHASQDYDIYGTLNTDSFDAMMHPTIVHEKGIIYSPGMVMSSQPDDILIEEGGQVITNVEFQATLKKNITGASSWKNRSVDGWYFIASPVNNLSTDVVALGDYDLYQYGEPDAMWWSNTGAHSFTTLERGTGYLYANSADQELFFAGTMTGSLAPMSIDLSFTGSQSDGVRGFNVVGNPFTCNLTNNNMTLSGSPITTCYVIAGGSDYEVINLADGDVVKPGQGFMIQAESEGQSLVFNTVTKDATNVGFIKIVASNENSTDKAYINVGNGNTLRKINLSDNSTKVYVMNDGKDYASARVDELIGSMPVNFKAAENGEYTITIEAKNAEVDYMHLIDNFTGEDVDLLLESSYTFNANAGDNEARFRLDFGVNGVNEIFENNVFAYQYGNEIIVNGNGELQVFDVMGRMIMNTKVNGVQSVAMPQGVYIFRMNDNIQKIVVR